jgi:hypothetical protein
MLRAAKQRAKRQNVPFDLQESDIQIPVYCPVLGTKLCRALGSKGPGHNSPSLDRIIPSRGYVPGNVVVISNRANRAKSDLSPDELKALSDFYGERK